MYQYKSKAYSIPSIIILLIGLNKIDVNNEMVSLSS